MAKKFVALVWTGFSTLIISTQACTQVIVKAASGEVVVANTVESGDFVAQHHGLFLQQTLNGEVLGGGNGKRCGADCAEVLATQPDPCVHFNVSNGFVGSMNEHGLLVSHHMLELSVYEQSRPGEAGVCTQDVDEWLLATFTSVAEVSTYLSRPMTDRLRIIADPLDRQPFTTYTWGIVDAGGSAIVLEFVKGQLRIHNNSVGVLTNDPTWDWHVTNLNMYTGLQPTWPDRNNEAMRMPVADTWYPWKSAPYTSDGHPQVPATIGHGFNLLGLPGDGSAAARFVRVFYQRAYAMQTHPPQTLEDALILGQELLNSVYKVKGTIPGRDVSDPPETTPVAVLAVPSTKEVYHRGRADMTWRKIDLKYINFAGAHKGRARVVSPSFYAIDVTDFLNGSHASAPSADISV